MTFHQELGSLEGVAQGALSTEVLPVEDVPELITEFSVTHEDVLPLGEWEDGLCGGPGFSLHARELEEHVGAHGG